MCGTSRKVNWTFSEKAQGDSILDKKECILNYAKTQIPIDLSALGLSVIKTREQFLSAYAMHDLATEYAAQLYLQNGFNLYPLGVDLRKHSNH